MVSVIEKIQSHAKSLKNNEDKVSPGQSARFTEACVVGDVGWQGDLKLTIVNEVPPNYIKIQNPTELDKQLVPGNTQGAKHCLDSIEGVELYRPKNWNEDSLEGPCLIIKENERTILHPTHGSVHMPVGMTILCSYQKEWDKEQAKERRAVD